MAALRGTAARGVAQGAGTSSRASGVQLLRAAQQASSTRHAGMQAWAPSPAALRTARVARLIATRSATQPTVPPIYLEQGGGDPVLAALKDHDSQAPRISAAEEARTWVQLARFGYLATVESDSGFPNSSLVEFAADPKTGLPVLAVSTLSAHTADLAATGRVSLTVASPRFAGLNDGRVTLQGTVRAVRDEEKPALREVYLQKYPNAFYVDFGDFRWFVLEDLRAVRFNGGFGRATKIAVQDYLAAQPDPVAAFSAPVCGHMNADHQSDNLAMVKHYTPLKDVEAVTLLDLDRLGLNTEVTRQGSKFKLRLPFPRPADNRKAIKEVIVEMTKTAKAAAAATSPA